MPLFLGGAISGGFLANGLVGWAATLRLRHEILNLSTENDGALPRIDCRQPASTY
jgi:hypothetical protein